MSILRVSNYPVEVTMTETAPEVCVCHKKCRGAVYCIELGWVDKDTEKPITYCNECGRWLGMSKDGIPIVGPSGWEPDEENY